MPIITRHVKEIEIYTKMSFHSNGYVGLRIHGSDPKFGRLNPLNLQVLQNPLLTYNSKIKD